MGDYNRPLSLNQWMYVEGNPINYSDPSGNVSCHSLPPEDRQECEEYKQFIDRTTKFYSQGRNWSSQDKEAVYDGVLATTAAFVNLLNHMGYPEMPIANMILKIFGKVAYHASSEDPDGSGSTSYYCERYTLKPTGTICYADSENHLTGPLIAHELAHVYNAVFSNKFPSSQTPYNQLDSLITSQQGFSYVDEDGISHKLAWYQNNQVDWKENGIPVIGIDKQGNPIFGKEGDKPIKHWVSQLNREERFTGQTQNLIFSNRRLVGEEFADMFANWVYGGFNGPAGIVRNTWMTNRLQADMSLIFGLPPNPYLPINDCKR